MPVMASEMGVFASIQLEVASRSILTVLDRGFFQNANGYSGIPHSHSSHELFLISRGECELVSGEGARRVGEHSMVLVPAGVPHRMLIRQEDMAYCKSFRFSVLSGCGKHRDNSRKPGPPAARWTAPDQAEVFPDCEAFCAAVLQMRSEFLAAREFYLEKAELLLKGFFIDFFRLMDGSGSEKQARQELDIHCGRLNGWDKLYVGPYKELIWDFIQCCADTLVRRCSTVEQIAGTLCVSQSQLKRIVKEASGNTLEHFLIERKIRAAQEMMKNAPDMPVHQVAETVGYHSYTGFYQAFRQVSGLTPTEYMESL